MSVLKNKRGVSQREYERAFNSMYQYFKIQLHKVPIRRKKWLNTPLTDILRDVHMTIMELTTGYTEPKNKQQWRYNLITHALHRLSDLQKPLYCHWVIMQTDERHRKTWCESINTEIALLHGMQKANPCNKPDDETEVNFIMYYKTSDIEAARFLSNSGKIIRKLVRTGIVRMRRKLKKFKGLVDTGKMSLEDVYASMQSWLEHARIAKSYQTRKRMLKLYDKLFGDYKITRKYRHRQMQLCTAA